MEQLRKKGKRDGKTDVFGLSLVLGHQSQVLSDAGRFDVAGCSSRPPSPRCLREGVEGAGGILPDPRMGLLMAKTA